MVLAIVKKELRETWVFAVLALVVYLIYLSNLTGHLERPPYSIFARLPGMTAETLDVPFVDERFVAILFCIGAALAITLGLRQSAWEPSQGTAQYLLHLPLTRRTIFLTKLTTGISLLLGCTLLPILIYAIWAAMPATHAGPFEWSMTRTAFLVWLHMPLAYLGAFASGIRPARWFGSRLLPLVSAALAGTILAVVAQWWPIALPLLLLVAAVLVSNILWEVETRDF
jgi:ABC-type transport system involved in multi-copper enzyme maturation permease subunit